LPRIAKEVGAEELILLCETRMFDIRKRVANDPRTVARDDVPWPRLGRDELRASLAGCIEAAREAGLSLRLPRMTMDDLLDYYSGVGLDLRQYVCRAPWYMQGIDATGNVGSCGYGLVGNVRDAPLAKLWNGESQRRFRRECRERLFALCPGCCFMEHRQEAGVASMQKRT
jgi:hypothetical protein